MTCKEKVLKRYPQARIEREHVFPELSGRPIDPIYFILWVDNMMLAQGDTESEVWRRAQYNIENREGRRL